MRKIETIATKEINAGGHECVVTGTWDDKPFYLLVFVEYDGRDVESETPMGGHNPMQDWEDPMFFDVLCEDKRFQKLHNEGYKVWEAFPQD